ncbi:MAG TPA: efflux RND transporter periplasmic adaptor subunit [Candidatus Marinimicrobia bacterium]|nr:efflux RND transporter periplasmic adaptor subunit [Candidatus Neomarinimicrobiota bacterium]
MKIMMKITMTILITGILSLTGCGKSPGTGDGQEEKIIPVNVTRVVRGSIENKIPFLGDIKAYQQVHVYAKVPEQITALYVDINDIVAKGDVLATVKDVSIRQGVLQAEAALSAARAQYNNVKTEWERIQQLYKESAVSKMQYDAVKAQKESAKSGVKQAAAALESAKEQLANTKIKAPISGIIAARNYELGDQTSPQMPAFTIIDVSKLKIHIDVIESEISRVKEGQKVLVKVTSYPDELFTGRVDKVYPVLNPLTRSAQVEIVIDNPDYRLRPGMYASVNIITEKKDDVLLIPAHAIIEKTNLQYLGSEISNTKVTTEKHVFIVKDNLALRRFVTTGIEDGGTVEILTGLNTNDILVTLGQYDLADSIKVRIVGKDIES